MDNSITINLPKDPLSGQNYTIQNNDDHAITICTDNSSIEIAPQVGQIKHENGQLLAYDGNEWHMINDPAHQDGYAEALLFLAKLDIKQVQELYKRKDEFLIELERTLLGKI